MYSFSKAVYMSRIMLKNGVKHKLWQQKNLVRTVQNQSREVSR